MIPSYGDSLITNTEVRKKVRAETASVLNIVDVESRSAAQA
jgi:hypothetical protein